MPIALTRRALLLSGSATALAVAAGLPLARAETAPTSLTLDDFLILSTDLTGVDGLDRQMGSTVYAGFLANGEADALADLSFDTANPAYEKLANAVVAAWYSGVQTTPAGTVVTDFTDALVWNALAFTKPFGFCGGETGYWADPPQT